MLNHDFASIPLDKADPWSIFIFQQISSSREFWARRVFDVIYRREVFVKYCFSFYNLGNKYARKCCACEVIYV